MIPNFRICATNAVVELPRHLLAKIVRVERIIRLSGAACRDSGNVHVRVRPWAT